MGEALKINSKLQTLWLFQNQVGDVGAKALGEALKINKTLTHLSIAQNHFGDDGAIPFAQAVKQNKVIDTLVLIANQVTDSCNDCIREAWRPRSGWTGESGLLLSDQDY